MLQRAGIKRAGHKMDALLKKCILNRKLDKSDFPSVSGYFYLYLLRWSAKDYLEKKNRDVNKLFFFFTVSIPYIKEENQKL
jgi:hypothetical protein